MFANFPDAVNVGEMWHIEKVKDVQNLGATKDAMCCLAGIFKNLTQETCSIFHWFPEFVFRKQKQGSVKNSDAIKATLKAIPETDKLEGLLIGGLAGSFYNKDISDLSKKMLVLLKRNLKHVKNQDFTVFFSQVGSCRTDWPASSFAYSNDSDTYFINCRKMAGELLTPQEIKDNFEYIHISPKDSVFFGDTQIPNNFFEKTTIRKKCKK